MVPLLLVSLAFFDEFASGVPAAAAFAVREQFGSGVSSVAFAVLVAPQVLSFGLEPALVLWAGRRHRPTALSVALGGMALSLGLAAVAPDLSSFGLAFALYAPASGVALGLAEASLMDQQAFEREQALTRWTLAGTLGDLAAPLLLWTLAASGLEWRAALGCAAFCLCCVSAAVVRARIATPALEPCSSASRAPRVAWRPLHAVWDALTTAWRRLRTAGTHAGLLLWLCAAAACTFMDEVFAVLVGLRVHDLTSDAVLVAQSLLAFTVGGALGLVLLERCLRSMPAQRLLVVTCTGSALCFGGWVALGVVAPEFFDRSPLLLLAAGAFTTAHYPLTLARAYAALPEDSTLVAATAQAFGAVDLLVPLVLGLVADEFGVGVALASLLAQPLGILVAVWWSLRSSLRPLAGERTLPP